MSIKKQCVDCGETYLIHAIYHHTRCRKCHAVYDAARRLHPVTRDAPFVLGGTPKGHVAMCWLQHGHTEPHQFVAVEYYAWPPTPTPRECGRLDAFTPAFLPFRTLWRPEPPRAFRHAFTPLAQAPCHSSVIPAS
jgi:hypothetical protein